MRGAILGPVSTPHPTVAIGVEGEPRVVTNAGVSSTWTSDTFDVLLVGRPVVIGRPDLPVATAVARAYERDGTLPLGSIGGHFAIFVLDRHRRRLLAARDQLGTTPLYFADGPRGLHVSTALRPAAEHSGVSREPDEVFLAQFLANRLDSTSRTPLRHVQRVPPGHLLDRTRRSTNVRRYWWPSTTRTICDPRTAREALAECLRSVVAELVPDRTAVQLSGGLDSSLVTTVAAATCEGLSAYCAVGDRSHDESDTARETAGRLGIDLHIIQLGSADPPPVAVDEATDTWDLPSFPLARSWRILHQAASSAGHTSTVTGVGGDELFGGSHLWAFDALRKGRVQEALRRLGLIVGQDRAPLAQVWTHLLAPAARMTLPGTVRRRLRPATPPTWLRPGWVQSVGVPAVDQGPISLGERLLWQLNSGWAVDARERTYRETVAGGLGLVQPLLDVRVVEQAIRVDDGCRWGEADDRLLERELIEHFDTTRARMIAPKVDFSSFVLGLLLRPNSRAALGNLSMASNAGWIDQNSVNDMVADATVAHARAVQYPHLWPLVEILAGEAWFRCIFG
jgi:asparagine synthetase B (glutamine-hydrolysing)